KHTFFEEGNSVIEQTVEYSFTKNGIFNLSLVGTPIQGRGYCSRDACHYSLPVQQNLVEVTQFFHEDGKIRILGSAEKNAQGNYVWWEGGAGRARILGLRAPGSPLCAAFRRPRHKTLGLQRSLHGAVWGPPRVSLLGAILVDMGETGNINERW